MKLRDQFESMDSRARFVSGECGNKKRGIAVVMLKPRGEPARISVIGSSISWGSVHVWQHRYRVLKMYQGGEVVPPYIPDEAPHRRGPQ